MSLKTRLPPRRWSTKPRRLPCEKVWPNYALFFDGANDAVRVPHHASLNLVNAITIVAWIYPTGWGLGNTGYIVSKEVTGWLLCLRNVGVAAETFRFLFNGITLYDAPSYSVVLNRWQCVGATYDRVRLKLWRNEKKVLDVAEAAALGVNVDDVYVGNRADITVRAFQGYIASVHVLGVCLSEEAYRAAVLRGYPSVRSDSVLCLGLEEGVGLATVDDSPYGNGGTLINGPVWTGVSQYKLLAEADL